MTNDRRSNAVRDLTLEAIIQVSSRYGCEGHAPMGYHNVTHLTDVVSAAGIIGKLAADRGKISYFNLDLLLIAAAFHDVEQSLGSGANEEASALLAVAAMRKTDVFTPIEIEIVDAMIRSTTVSFKDGVMVQLITDVETGYLPFLMADADLATLGAPWDTYFDRVTGLQLELKGADPSQDEIRAFLEGQLKLLDTHEFFTDEARELYPHQAFNLDRMFATLAELDE